MPSNKQPPTLGPDAALRRVEAFHLQTQKWRPLLPPEVRENIYTFSGPSGKTAVYASHCGKVCYLGPMLSPQSAGLVSDVKRMRKELGELGRLFNETQALAARTLRLSGFTAEQAGASLEITHGRVCQITGPMGLLGKR